MYSHTSQVTVGDKIFSVKCYPQTQIGYELVLEDTRRFLETIVEDNARGLSREGVRKVDDESHVNIPYLLGKMGGFCGNHSSTNNRKDMTTLDKSGQKIPLDDTVTDMLVYLDSERYSRLDPVNANNFHRALSLKSGLNKFMREYKAMVFKEHDIAENLEKSLDVTYELGDGSAVRFLFVPSKTIQHGEIYKGLVGMETKGIAASTGDLTILSSLDFPPSYRNIRGTSGVVVDSVDAGFRTNVKITRISKGVENVRTYHVVNTENGVYASVLDIQDTMKHLAEKNRNVEISLNVGFYSASPRPFILQT